MFVLNEKSLPLDTPFTIGEGDSAIQYPANFLRLSTSEEKAALGITEQPDPEVYDQRFYWGVDNPKQLNDETITPEDGDPYVQKGLKSNWSAQIKDTTNKLLAATDWMVIRKAERNVDIPTGTAAYRTAVLVECDRLLADVTSSNTVEEFVTVVTTQNWPKAE